MRKTALLSGVYGIPIDGTKPLPALGNAIVVCQRRVNNREEDGKMSNGTERGLPMVGSSNTLRVWINHTVAQRFHGGVEAHSAMLQNGGVQLTLTPTPDQRMGKRVKPGKIMERDGVPGYVLNFSTCNGKPVTKCNLPSFGYVMAESARIDGESYRIIVPAERPQLLVKRAFRHNADKSIAPTAAPPAINLAVAVRYINEQKAELGGGLVLEIKEDGSLRAAIMQEFE